MQGPMGFSNDGEYDDMKALFDTSVLVAAMVSSHPAHLRAFKRLQEVRDGAYQGFVSVHSLAEIYSVMTKLPVRPRLSPKNAMRLINQNVVENFDAIHLEASDYVSLIDRLARTCISGGSVFDALIVSAGLKAGVEKIITLNPKDFKRVYPEHAEIMVEPYIAFDNKSDSIYFRGNRPLGADTGVSICRTARMQKECRTTRISKT